MPNITVIGAVNIDICGKPDRKFVPCDSNVGSVSHSIGGVGFNIARNLSLLGCNVSFVAALGNDTYTPEIEKEAENFKIDLSLCLRTDEQNSTYLFITDESGDMLAAVNDMKISKRLDKDFFEPLFKTISKSDAVIIDANLESELLEYLCKNINAPIFADAVSASKVMRLKKSFGYLHSFKPNAIEASVLTGIEVKDFDSAKEAAKVLVDDFGIGRVYITLGSKGLVAYDGETFIQKPTVSKTVINTAGAGDAFFACTVAAELMGKSFEECAEIALKGAASVCKTEKSINTDIFNDVFK